jgi:hypothetical protein
MKKILLIGSAMVLGFSLSHATITGVPTWDYSGGLYCYSPVFSSANQSVSLSGYQNNYGSIGLGITTDTSTDPTLTINNSINNQSSFAWTEYIVSVAMNQSFTISTAAATAPPGWTAGITQPGAPVAGIYTGIIDYVGGTPVANSPGPNNILNFGYSVTFSGSTSYSLTESANPVPEPNMAAFLLISGTLLGGWMIARRRSAGGLAK